MDTTIYESELAFLHKFWNDLTTEQRCSVVDKFCEADSFDQETLEDLLSKCELPYVDEFPIPDIEMCNDVLEKMTPDETQKLEGYVGFTIKYLMEHIETSDVLFNVMQNYLSRNFNLNLPPLKLWVIPDYYEIPFTIRKKTRRELRKCLNSHRQIA
jgi:hypothetical protein